MSKVYKFTEGIFFKEKGDEGIVCVDAMSDDFVLYEFALEDRPLIDMLKEGTSFEALKAWMASEYDVDDKTLERDLREFIDDLVEHNIIKK